MQAWKRVAVSLLAVVLVVACNQEDDRDSGPPPRDPTPSESSLVEATNTFGFDLFREVVARAEDRDVFLSPLSVSTALAMTLNGAAGDTRTAMAGMLGLDRLPATDVNAAYQGLLDLLMHTDRQVRLQVANSIWYRRGFTVDPLFLDLNAEFFDARVEALDFADPSAVTTINGWVDDSTNGLIDAIIAPPIDATTMLFVINAVYFKGSWTQRFDASRTRTEAFHAPSGDMDVPMMHVEADLPFCESVDFRGVDLPYGRGDFRMMILLPQYGSDLETLTAALTPENWAGRG